MALLLTLAVWARLVASQTDCGQNCDRIQVKCVDVGAYCDQDSHSYSKDYPCGGASLENIDACYVCNAGETSACIHNVCTELKADLDQPCCEPSLLDGSNKCDDNGEGPQFCKASLICDGANATHPNGVCAAREAALVWLQAGDSCEVNAAPNFDQDRCYNMNGADLGCDPNGNVCRRRFNGGFNATRDYCEVDEDCRFGQFCDIVDSKCTSSTHALPASDPPPTCYTANDHDCGYAMTCQWYNPHLTSEGGVCANGFGNKEQYQPCTSTVSCAKGLVCNGVFCDKPAKQCNCDPWDIFDSCGRFSICSCPPPGVVYTSKENNKCYAPVPDQQIDRYEAASGSSSRVFKQCLMDNSVQIPVSGVAQYDNCYTLHVEAAPQTCSESSSDRTYYKEVSSASLRTPALLLSAVSMMFGLLLA